MLQNCTHYCYQQIKNPHLISYLYVSTQWLFIAHQDQHLQIYSLNKMISDRPSYVKQISFMKIFQQYKHSYNFVEDKVSIILKNIQENSTKNYFFDNNNNIDHNIFNKQQTLQNRLIFLNHHKYRMKTMKCDNNGNLVFLLNDGRGCVLFAQRSPRNIASMYEKCINLNNICKGKIIQFDILSNQIALLYTVSNENSIDLTYFQANSLEQKSQNMNNFHIKKAVQGLNYCKFVSHSKLILIYATYIEICGIFNTKDDKRIQVNSFINDVYWYSMEAFIITAYQVWKFNYQNCSLTLYRKHQIIGSQIVHIDQNGNYYYRTISNINECIYKTAQSQNGLIFVITWKKNGNYKEGGLYLCIPKINIIMQHIINNVKKSTRQTDNILFFGDLYLLCGKNQRKQLIIQLSNYYKENVGLYKTINSQQLSLISIHISHILEIKCTIKMKFIIDNLNKIHKNSNLADKTIILRCMFTLQQIDEQEQIVECQVCNLYGIGIKYLKCIICKGRLNLI